MAYVLELQGMEAVTEPAQADSILSAWICASSFSFVC